MTLIAILELGKSDFREAAGPGSGLMALGTEIVWSPWKANLGFYDRTRVIDMVGMLELFDRSEVMRIARPIESMAASAIRHGRFSDWSIAVANKAGRVPSRAIDLRDRLVGGASE